MNGDGYKIKCGSHTYVTLTYEDKFLSCLDNDIMFAEDIIINIEKRTKMKFKDIEICGDKEDFRGLVFYNGGWKRDFWEEFPTDTELAGYIKMKEGR